MQLHSQQLTQQHRQTAITVKGNHLSITVSELCANRMRQSIRHAAVAERTNLLALPVRGDVTRAPDVAHARVDGKDSILCRFLINDICDELGVQRRHLLNVRSVRVNDLGEFLVMLLEHLVQEGTVRLFLYMRQDIRDGRSDITSNRI